MCLAYVIASWWLPKHELDSRKIASEYQLIPMQISRMTQSLTICMWYNTPNTFLITKLLNSDEPVIKGILRDPILEAASGYFPAVFQFFSLKLDEYTHTYEGCPESIQPFLISREPVAWPWFNTAANQRRPYCASVNRHCSVGLVSRQWDAVDWACVLCGRRIHNERASKSASLQ